MYDTYEQKDSDERSVKCKKSRNLCPELHISFLISADFNFFPALFTFDSFSKTDGFHCFYLSFTFPLLSFL